MENKKLIGLSIALLVAFLGSVGYNIKQDTYYCSDRGIVQECLRFSSSGNRCYPNLVNNQGYRDCPSGWTKLNSDTQIQPSNTLGSQNPEKYQCCSQTGCIAGRCDNV